MQQDLENSKADQPATAPAAAPPAPASSDLEAAQAKIKELTADNARLKAVETQVRRAAEAAAATRAQALAAADASNKELAAAREQIAKLTEDLAAADSRAKSQLDAVVKKQAEDLAAADSRAKSQLDAVVKKQAEDLAAADSQAKSQLDVAVKKQAALEEHVKTLTAELDVKTSELARVSAAAHAAASERSSAREEIAGLTDLRDKAIAEVEEIRAWGETILSRANALHDRLQALDGEGFVAFVKRRYFGRG